MKLALLAGASPKTSNGGPVVRLQEGEWRISSNGIVDSKFTLVIDATSPTPFDEAMSIKGPCTVNAVFRDRGSEQFVSLYAELIRE